MKEGLLLLFKVIASINLDAETLISMLNKNDLTDAIIMNYLAHHF